MRFHQLGSGGSRVAEQAISSCAETRPARHSGVWSQGLRHTTAELPTLTEPAPLLLGSAEALPRVHEVVREVLELLDHVLLAAVAPAAGVQDEEL